MKRLRTFGWLVWFWAGSLLAWEPFVVEDVRIRGLQRVAAGTVFNYLPVKPGETLDEKKAAAAIRALFKTGFFKDVRLAREGNVLVIEVVERPSIAAIKIVGNQDIKTEDLTKALESVGLAEGRIFNRRLLEKIESELRRQYFSHGKYGVKIKTEVTPITHNRVAILIKIAEGKVAKIKRINIVGNRAFDDDTLLDQFELGTTGWLSFYTKNDQYSKQKLAADLERLRSFYMDRGYLKFEIESTQVAITPDKRDIYITINVREGDVYRLESVRLTGKLIVPPHELTALLKLGPGEVFSRKAATESIDAITKRLGDEGYLFANVNMVPEIDEAKKTVKLTFFVDPGRRVYVRRIHIKGNSRTQDEVVRREMRQMEAALAQSTKIEQSKQRIQRLGYFKEVNVETPQVPGAEDLIDLNFSVTEQPSGNLSAGIGFSQVQGLIFNASVSQTNFLGTGKQVSFEFNNSQVSTIYRVNLYDPYFTLDGIGAGFHVSYRSIDADNANIANYTTNTLAAGLSGGIPMSEWDRLNANMDFSRTELKTSGDTSDEILDFIEQHGETYGVMTLGMTWVHDTRDKAVFPTRGGRHSLSLLGSLPFVDLEYYKIRARGRYFFPWTRDLIFSLHGDFAYGDGYGGTDELPFFEHFFAGGVKSVRGFRQNTLGPRDSNNNPFGGNVKLVGGAELFFPVPFLSEEFSSAFRMGVFFDAGNVFKDSLKPGDLRYSAGISAQWLSPFGPLEVSLAQPLNAKSQDDEQVFQFSFGAGF
ncbi:outer membrane protein insertion porin family [Methylomarinovum tepidoasis]|uniref:Outer membrane protein assembly factor BamA n=1 Tax=Methylomarinovum tepidoasis TaxID=2840183 RepID=A0AAU9C434_9GAMM|nr:outer membrane protein assembly factor BamA [Methylomarinovum sp. IN45]BCX87859.1 outer membrane protein insertion porin family [Methylomarinovum sp. IN45]